MAVVIPLVAALLLFYGITILLKTGCIDPGIVPRAQADEVAYQTALADEGKEERERGREREWLVTLLYIRSGNEDFSALDSIQ